MIFSDQPYLVILPDLVSDYDVLYSAHQQEVPQESDQSPTQKIKKDLAQR